MKLTFVHDGPVFFDKEGNYYEFAYHELLQRYSYLADSISFMMRTKSIDENRKYTLVPNEINIVSIPNFKSPKLFFLNIKQAEKIISEQVKNSDYLILRMPSSIAQLALKYIKKYNKPYIIESVGCPWDSYWNHGFLGKLVAPYMYLKTRSAIAQAPFVYYVTSNFLQKRYPTKGKTVSCSNVVLEKMNPETLENRIEKIKNFHPQKKLVLGTAAALDTRYKGQEYVINAINHLVALGYDVEYRLAGGFTGPSPNTFLADLARDKGVSERVVFSGSQSSEQMDEYYDSIDIYVQPSKQEGLPRAVIEAMSRGCPVIGTDVAGNSELIQKSFLFRKGSSKEVQKALQRILNSDLEQIAKENFKMAQNYEKEKLRVRREAFYDVFLSEIQ